MHLNREEDNSKGEGERIAAAIGRLAHFLAGHSVQFKALAVAAGCP